MADYYSQTVIRPDIPRAALTALEFAVLTEMFGHEAVGDDVYLTSRFGPNDIVTLSVSEVHRWLADCSSTGSELETAVRNQLEDMDAGEAQFDLDMSVIGFEGILQDVVKRSALDYIEVETAWTCTKMRPHGFGGSATLITAGAIETVSTGGWLEEMIGKLTTADDAA